jgi:hypothetical protein
MIVTTRLPAFAAVILGLSLPAMAQAPADTARGETVSWSASTGPDGKFKPGGRLTLTLRGKVLEGWHVYALNQLPGGPTPLHVTVDANDVATADGAPAGSPAETIHDSAFNLDTPFYSNDFTLTVPVRLGSHPVAGQQVIPVSVRFQTCNGRVCQPPKTVRLSAPVPAGG